MKPFLLSDEDGVFGVFVPDELDVPDYDRCRNCGGIDHSFDRSLCACGAMHYYCDECGSVVGECPYDVADES